MNRRALIGQAAGGASLGVTWCAGFVLASRFGDPTLEVIGSEDAQFALLNTRRFRTLIVLGHPPKILRDQLASLLGVFRHRVDLLIGSRSGIEALGNAFVRERRVARTIALDDDSAPVASGIETRVAPAVLSADLPEDVRLRICALSMLGWSAASTERRSWLVEIRRGAALCCLGPNLDDVAMHGPVAPALALGAKGSVRFAAPKLQASAIAINRNAVEESWLGPPATEGDYLIRIHPRTTAIFTLTSGGIQLPHWVERRPILPI